MELAGDEAKSLTAPLSSPLSGFHPRSPPPMMPPTLPSAPAAASAPPPPAQPASPSCSPASRGQKVELAKLLVLGGGSPLESDVGPDSSPRSLAELLGDMTPNLSRGLPGSFVHFPPGLQPPLLLGSPSRGSAFHGAGTCRPCAWFHKAGGCQNDQNCGHCHLCPDGEIKDRKRTKRAVMRLGLDTPKAHSKLHDEGHRPCDSPAPSFAELDSSTTGYGSDPASAFGGDFAIGGCSSSEQEGTTPREDDQDSVSRSRAPSWHAAGRSVETELITSDVRMGPPPGLVPLQTGLQWDGHVCSDGVVKAKKKSKQAAMRLAQAAPWSESATSPAQAGAPRVPPPPRSPPMYAA